MIINKFGLWETEKFLKRIDLTGNVPFHFALPLFFIYLIVKKNSFIKIT